MTKFIDRSNVNGADNYKLAGITHIYLKATEGTTFTDSTYKSRKAEAIAAGAVVGAYHFAGHADPKAEAKFFLDTIGTPNPGRFRPCLDLESGQNATWAAAFVEAIHAKLGYWPVIYGNTSTIPTLRAASVSVRACPWWRAEYGPNDGQRHALQGGDQGCAAHQYTSVAKIAGISGNTDQSAFIKPAEAMLVPQHIVKPTKPDHYILEYTDKFGHPAKVTTKHPHLWQSRRPRVGWRGPVHQIPVHKK